MDERESRMALTCVVEGGTSSLAQAVGEFGAVEVWRGLTSGRGDSPISRRARQLQFGPVMQLAAEHQMRFVIPGDDDWPARLVDLQACEAVNGMTGVPVGLWVCGGGDLGQLTELSVAVVGSRASTPYGETVAADLAAGLSEAGYTVVSGGAFGIDAAAHRGAMSGRTPTVAVLAGGLDQPYPSGHRSLFERISEQGLLVSELPPGQHPTRMRFLSRNRLIAAVAPGTVMVEAAARSGARNTVTWANALHRVVMAVPGPVTSANSVTPHRLIRESEAVLVTQAAEVLDLLSPLNRGHAERVRQPRPLDVLTSEELAIFEAVPGRGSLAAGEIALKSGVSLGRCLAVLDDLGSRGFLAQNPRLEWQLPGRRIARTPAE